MYMQATGMLPIIQEALLHDMSVSGKVGYCGSIFHEGKLLYIVFNWTAAKQWMDSQYETLFTVYNIFDRLWLLYYPNTLIVWYSDFVIDAINVNKCCLFQID